MKYLAKQQIAVNYGIVPEGSVISNLMPEQAERLLKIGAVSLLDDTGTENKEADNSIALNSAPIKNSKKKSTVKAEDCEADDNKPDLGDAADAVIG